LFIGLVSFAVVVTLFAAVGHALWMAGAAILRKVFRIGKKGRLPTCRCTRCGQPGVLEPSICRECGHESQTARRRSLTSAIRQIKQYHTRYGLDPTVFDHALQALTAAEQHLLGAVASDVASDVQQRQVAPTAAADGVPRPPQEVVHTRPRPACDPAVLEMPAAAAGATAPAVPDFARDTPPAPAAFSPRRTLADMLQSFLDEKNIRWGELASGMLILGSVIGLVISLRATLVEISERIRYFPALLFLLGIIAIHGAGLYTLRRWRLRATSRGVLIIALLLVPLGFVAGILLSGPDAEQRAVTDPLYLAAVTVGLVSYGTLTAVSARALFAEGWWRFVVAIMGTAAGQLLINRLADADLTSTSLLRTTALFLVPLASFLAATLTQLFLIAQRARLSRARAAQTFTLLGTAGFALAVAVGLLLYRAGTVQATLAALSPSLSLAAAVVLGIGMSVHTRCAARTAAETRTVGTALAVLGGLLMAGTMFLAWPLPPVLIAVAAVTAGAFLCLACLGNVPVLHAGAAAAATWAGLLTFLRQTVPLAESAAAGTELVRALVMGRSALALAVAAVALGAIGCWCRRRQLAAVARGYLSTAGAVAAISAAIGLYAGFWTGVDAAWTTLLFACLATAGLTASWCWPIQPMAKPQRGPFGWWRTQRAITLFGAAASLVTLVHLLGWNTWVAAQLAAWQWTIARPVLWALIGHGVFMELLALSARRWHRTAWAVGGGTVEGREALSRELIVPLATCGVLSAVLAVPGALSFGRSTLGAQAAYVGMIAAVWTMAGVAMRVPRLISGAYVATTVALGLAVAAGAAAQPWPEPVLGNLQHVQWQALALGLWCAAVFAACSAVPQRRVAHFLLTEVSGGLNRGLLVGLIALMAGLGLVGCQPGALVELGYIAPDHAWATDAWHTQAYQVFGLLAWLSVALALGAAIVPHGSQFGSLAAIALTASLPLLVAGRWESGWAVASACRWAFALYTACWTLLLTAPRQLMQTLRRWLPAARGYSAGLTDLTRDTAFAVGTLPLLGLTLLATAQLACGTAWNGPLTDTWFARITPAVSYAVPVAVLAVTALMHAAREGRAVYALFGAVMCECALALAVVLDQAVPRAGWTVAQSVTLVQTLTAGLAGYGLIWLALSRWIERDAARLRRPLLKVQIAGTGLAAAGLAAWAVACLFVDVHDAAPALEYLGRWPSYLAVGLAVAAVAWFTHRDARYLAGLAVGAPVVLAPIVAASICPATVARPCDGYQLLISIWLGIGLSAAVAVCWQRLLGQDQPWLAVVRRASAALGLAVFVLNLGAEWPATWWTIGVYGGLAALWTVLGIGCRSQWCACASVVSLLCGAWLLWEHVAVRAGLSGIAGCYYVTILTGTVAALIWLLVEIWYQHARHESFDPRPGRFRVHAVLVWGLTALLGAQVAEDAMATIVAGRNAGGMSLTITDFLGITALVAMGILLVATLWDQRLRASLLALYLWGLTTLGMAVRLLDQLTDQGAALTVMAACLAGAGYIALTGHLWKSGVRLAQWGARLHIPHPVARLEHAGRWLPALSVLGTVLLCLLGFVTVFVADDRAMRMGAAFAPGLLAYGIGCLAQGARRGAMQCLALLVLSLAAVYIGWADVGVAAEQARMLAYAARLLISVAGMTLLYAFVVARWIGPQSGWYEAVRKASLILAAITISTLAAVLALEVACFTPHVPAPITTLEVLAISVMLGGFVVALLSMALWPGKDPLHLSERGRTAYVYAAQCVAGLLFAHVYLAQNQLFHGRFRDFWPYIIMALAFGSVAFGELCLRRNWRVIADPLLRTGGFLPLVPALTTWTFSSTSPSLVLFCGGLVYVFLAVTRRSFGAGIVAAVMGNGALWALLSEQGLHLCAQPQFWLIPPALSMLVAAHINRDRLSDASLTTIRYVCMAIIYVSSAGEMFMKLVVPETPEDWLRPIILASLAVGGVFAGILLRVRAFLYLGSSFLLLAIVAMVWNAGRLVDHTWPWWVFGISAGLASLVVFGVFEKHRPEVKSLVARLRQWDA